MARTLLLLLFAAILLGMIVVTVTASLDTSIWEVPSTLTSDPWFWATLADAYFGFITFYVWVAYREATSAARVIWFVAIMALGNIAMSVYMLIRLWLWQPSQGVEALLLRSNASQ